jgi:hypothetical protein
MKDVDMMSKLTRYAMPFTVSVIIASVPASGQTTFNDVTAEAGVGDASFGVGAAWGDFDGDGWLDLYLVNLGQGNKLYLNNGDGTFANVTARAGVGDGGDGVGCAWGDYNNDGLPDLFVSNRPGADRLYRYNGDTTFTDVAPEFGMSDPSGLGESVAWGDYDSDGFIDLYKIRMQQSNILYHNVDGENFEDVTSFAGVGHAGTGEGTSWCDYDNDGYLDIYATNASGYNPLYRNNGDGTFSECSEQAGIRDYGASFGCSWGDYDNDGDFDLYVGKNGANRLFQNSGDGTFDEVGGQAGVDYSGWTLGVAWADYDNDGWLDLHLAIHQGDDVLYRNLGDCTFEDVTDQAGVHNHYNARGNVWGDYNNDGFLDLYVVNHDGAENILFENQGNDNHFLNINLIGDPSNKAGIGSRVVCVAGDLRMTSLVDGGSGFASQNSLPVEFGLGDNIVADSLYILWPSGVVDILTDIEADQFLDIAEGGTVGIDHNEEGRTPEKLRLLGAYPNPFNGATSIRYILAEDSRVVVGIYDILGRKVETLVRERESPGLHQVTWEAESRSSGLYFYRVQAGEFSETKKMLLVR